MCYILTLRVFTTCNEVCWAVGKKNKKKKTEVQPACLHQTLMNWEKNWQQTGKLC